MDDNGNMKFALEWPDRLKHRLKLNNAIIKDTFKDKDFIEALSKQVDINIKRPVKKQNVDTIKSAMRGKTYTGATINKILNSKIKALEYIKTTLVEEAEFEKTVQEELRLARIKELPSDETTPTVNNDNNNNNNIIIPSQQQQIEGQHTELNPDTVDQSLEKKIKPEFIYRVYKLKNDYSDKPEKLQIQPYTILDIKHNPRADLSKLTSVTNYVKFQRSLFAYYYAIIENDPLTVYCQYFHNNVVCNHKLTFKNKKDMQTRIRKRFRYHCLTHHFEELDLNKLFDTVNPLIWNSIRSVLRLKEDLTDEEKLLKEQQFPPLKSTDNSSQVNEPNETSENDDDTDIDSSRELSKTTKKKSKENTILEKFIQEKEDECIKRLKEIDKIKDKYEKLLRSSARLKKVNKTLTEKVNALKAKKTTKPNKVIKPQTTTTTKKKKTVPKNKSSNKQKNLSNDEQDDEPLQDRDDRHNNNSSSNNNLFINQNNSFVSSPSQINDNFNNLMSTNNTNEPISVMSPMYHDNTNYGLQMNPNGLPDYQSRIQNSANQVIIPPLDINNQAQFNSNGIPTQSGHPRLLNHNMLNNSRNLAGKANKPVIAPKIRNINNTTNITPDPNPRLGYNNW